MKDGLYRVVLPRVVAGFVIHDGCVVKCAPILRGNLRYWMRIAKWVCE